MPDKTSVPEECFHCGDLVPKNTHWTVHWKNIPRPMCCPGCQAVCETIIESGLDEYYLLRENNPDKPESLIPLELQRINSYNRPEISQAFIQKQGELQQAIFYIEGMTCAACAWLIEKKVSELPFVERISINAISNLANISWFPGTSENNKNIEKNETSHMGDILSSIQATGYSAKPLLSEQLAIEHKKHQKELLKRLGLAGLGMMQVMMFAIGLYSGTFQGMEQKYQIFLRWVSWVVATPVVLYAASPFYKAAWRNIKSFDLGMNVPVSIAIGSAYFASSYATFTGTGEVYFDSAVMFTFFLLVGRFLQSRAGWRASETNLTTNLSIAPTVQTQVDNQWRFQAVNQLKKGDLILVTPGESIPVDGIIEKGTSEISTAIINGEFEPKKFTPGERVLAASINQTQPLEIRCESVGSDRFVEKLAQRQQQALAEKPPIVSLADTLSHWFVLAVLAIAVITAIIWTLRSPDDAFWITLSVLVVSCPCALSLATPAAITAAIAQASKIGFLINKPEVLERLAKTDWIVFDKTGTLTRGILTITKIESLNTNFSEEKIIQYSAAIETGSSHPIASAILKFVTQKTFTEEVSERTNVPGKGVTAVIDGRQYELGSFSKTNTDKIEKSIILSEDGLAVGRIYLSDPWREDSHQSLQKLKLQGYQLAVLSGDPSIDTEALSHQLGVDVVIGSASPNDKIDWVVRKQQQGDSVLMVGDGINDSPVLSQANSSVAMSSGAALSKTGSDATLLNGKISSLLSLLQLSKKARSIIKQNLIWAALYNAITIPLAATGKIPPWLAAIGMSVSSLFVVVNALRLNHNQPSISNG